MEYVFQAIPQMGTDCKNWQLVYRSFRKVFDVPVGPLSEGGKMYTHPRSLGFPSTGGTSVDVRKRFMDVPG